MHALKRERTARANRSLNQWREQMATETLFEDNFTTNGKIDAAKWNYNVWTQRDNKSYLGRTQQRQELPIAENGIMRLRLNTFNPPPGKPDSLFGSEAISKKTFGPPGPQSEIVFEAQLRYEQNQRGIIGGFFTFAGPADTHDEIDFEAMSNSFNQIQTNIYRNEPLGDGHFEYHNLSDSLSTFHTYTIAWGSVVVWSVDGKVVRTERTRVPTKPMNLHFNIWAGPASWPTGDSSLKVATNSRDDKTFYFDVKAVKVQRSGSLV
jgi:hypothetical protein